MFPQIPFNEISAAISQSSTSLAPKTSTLVFESLATATTTQVETNVEDVVLSEITPLIQTQRSQKRRRIFDDVKSKIKIKLKFLKCVLFPD